MRICTISLLNLNSLSGRWNVDFTAPEYIQSGIFAITGPTGSGKSTILDALCLALYGRTPRLDRVNKSTNDVMSRGAGECFAEVTFETVQGRYTAHWSQRRARLRSEGELQAPKHEIAHTDGAVIESSLRLVAEKIIELTGMDFDRFTRSMLLAQGGFAAFLNAAPDDRSPILEQITGTEIYSRISQLVHEQTKCEREQLELINGELRGIAILSSDESELLQKSIDDTSTRVLALGKEREMVQAALGWLSGIEQLEKEIDVLEKQYREAVGSLEAFKPESIQLQASQRAAALEGDFLLQKKLRDQLDRDGEELTKNSNHIQKINSSISEKKQQYKEASQRLLDYKNEAATLQPVVRHVRELDQQIKHLNGELSVVQQEIATVEASIASSDGEKVVVCKKKEDVTSDRERVMTYCNDHPEDAALGDILIRVTEKNAQRAAHESTRIRLLKKIEDLQARKSENKVKCINLTSDVDKSVNEIERYTTLLQQQKTDLTALLAGKTIADLRKEHETLLRERGYLQRIVSLEDERKHLIDGSPCPLCGATEHPFTHETTPELSSVDIQIETIKKCIEMAEAFGLHIAATDTLIQENKARLHEKEQVLLRAQNETDLFTAELQRDETQLQEIGHQIATLLNDILAMVHPSGVSVVTTDTCNELIATLQKRAVVWRKAGEKLEQISKTEMDVLSTLAILTERISAFQKQRNEHYAKMQQSTIERDEFKRQRTELFSDRDPETVENDLNKKLSAAEKEVQTFTSALQQEEREWHALTASIDLIEKRITTSTVESEGLRKSFLELCQKAGFTTETDFEKALLPQSERLQLESRLRSLEEEVTKYQVLAQSRSVVMQEELARKITSDKKSTLIIKLDEYDAALRTMSELLGGYKLRLENDRENRLRASTHVDRIEKQQRVCARWDLLHSLIGSADGKKYRNFAQGITFEYLLAHANTQLQKMSDRYLLTTENNQPLELFVVDNYQAGEVRTARNLSGGESFIVSMALALGLSSMAGKRIRVNSLFLDEGFGTLDEDALETALETLSELKQDGKLIGVISHVSALKERIATRITVTPVSGGKSALSGPGCTRGD